MGAARTAVRLRTQASARLVAALMKSAPLRTMHALFLLCAAIWPALHMLSFGFDATAIAGWIVLVSWLLVRRAAFREVAALPARYLDAFANSDADALADLHRVSGLFYDDPRVADANWRCRVGEEMLVRKRWPEARAALADVDHDVLPLESRALALNNLAYATARCGDAETAVTLAERALALAERLDTEAMRSRISSLRGTLGIALTLANRHEDALPILEEVAEEDAMDRLRNERLYWLGRVYRAVGRQDDATAAWTRAAGIAGPCADDARSALAARMPFRD